MEKPLSSEPKRCRSASGDITRQRIVDALLVLLEQKPIWKISIADITREVGVSSQLFYRHFKTLEDVLLAHAEVILNSRPDIASLIAGDWRGEAGLARARAIVEANLGFWEQHRTAMRVITVLGDQQLGDFAKFRGLRGRIAANAFAAQLAAQQKTGSLPAEIDPAFAGWMLVSQLQIIGLSYPQVIANGTPHDTLVETAARVIQRIVVGD